MIALLGGETEQEDEPVRWHRETKWRQMENLSARSDVALDGVQL
jgi:hypothetical protein